MEDMERLNNLLEGFKYGKIAGNDIVEFIKGMGISREGWIKQKENYHVNLEHCDILKLDVYFEIQNKKQQL